jgi:predicted nucleic acid-binding protein
MKNNRIILDTTYILPLFGIKIKDLSKLNEGINLMFGKEKRNFDVFLPSICLIEVLYKLVHEYKKNKDYDILNRYSLVIPTLTSSKNFTLFNPYLNSTATQFALKLRHSGHSDMFDCLIAGTAISVKGILLTEDNVLKNKLKDDPETKFLSIWSWNDFRDNYIK